MSDEIVYLHFPIRLVLTGSLANATRALGNARFVNGISDLLDYRAALAIAGNYTVYELESGVRFHPLGERRLWRVADDTNFWMPGNKKMHKAVLEREERREDDERWQAAMRAKISPVETHEPVEASAVADDSKSSPDGADFGPGVDLSHVSAAIAALDEKRAALEALLKKYGARFIRQLAQSRDLKGSHAGAPMIQSLLESGITLDEIKAATPREPDAQNVERGPTDEKSEP